MATGAVSFLPLGAAGGDVAAVSFSSLTATGATADTPVQAGDVSFELLTATGESSPVGTAYGTASFEALTASGGMATAASVSMEAMTAVGYTANVAQGSVSFEKTFINTKSGYVNFQTLSAYGVSEAATSAATTVKVMNTRTSEVTEYTNYEFNSFARVNGVHYAASDDGIFRLSGDDDAGTDIPWAFRTGMLDDSSEKLKRLPEIVVGLRATGPVKVRVYRDDEEYHDYTLPVVNNKSLHQTRVKPGKGMRSRYYAVELQNMADSRIELDSLQINFEETKRRVG